MNWRLIYFSASTIWLVFSGFCSCEIYNFNELFWRNKQELDVFYIEFINGSIILFAEDFVCMVSIPLNLLNFVLLEDSVSWYAFEKKNVL